MADVCVIVLNWNGWNDTLGCFDSLLPDVLHGRASVVVVDNASSDDSVARIDEWLACTAAANSLLYGNGGSESDLALIRSSGNRGYAGGNNLGLEYALAHHRGEFVWVLNNDTTVHEHALEGLLRYARDGDDRPMLGSTIVDFCDRETVQCAGGATHNAWLTTYHPACGGEPLSSVLARETEPRLDYVCGAAMFVRMEVLRQVGLLNTDYFLYYEEIDYARRAAARGYRPRWCRNSIVYHKGGASAGSRIGPRSRKSAFAEYHSNLSALKYTRRFHPGILPIAFACRLCLKVVNSLVHGDTALLRPLFAAYRDFLLVRGSEHTWGSI